MNKWFKRLAVVIAVVLLLCLLLFLFRVAWLFFTGALSYNDGFFYFQY